MVTLQPTSNKRKKHETKLYTLHILSTLKRLIVESLNLPLLRRGAKTIWFYIRLPLSGFQINGPAVSNPTMYTKYTTSVYTMYPHPYSVSNWYIYITKNLLWLLQPRKNISTNPPLQRFLFANICHFSSKRHQNDTKKHRSVVISESTQPHAKARDIFHDLRCRANIDFFAKQVIFLSKLHIIRKPEPWRTYFWKGFPYLTIFLGGRDLGGKVAIPRSLWFWNVISSTSNIHSSAYQNVETILSIRNNFVNIMMITKSSKFEPCFSVTSWNLKGFIRVWQWPWKEAKILSVEANQSFFWKANGTSSTCIDINLYI